MGQAKTRLGTSTTVPETDETDWGTEVTAQLCDMLDGTTATLCWTDTAKTVIGLKITSTTSSIANGGSVTVAGAPSVIKVSGASGAITLSAVTAITDGSTDGQILILIGNHASSTVTIPHGANTQMNGNCTLNQHDAIRFRWDAATADWIELGRTN